MKITNVNVKLSDAEKVKAIVSITIDDCFKVTNIRIIQGMNGLFIAMPSRKLPSGEFADIAFPVTKEAREYIQNEVLNAYQNTING